jgi:hypothetical protein
MENAKVSLRFTGLVDYATKVFQAVALDHLDRSGDLSSFREEFSKKVFSEGKASDTDKAFANKLLREVDTRIRINKGLRDKEVFVSDASMSEEDLKEFALQVRESISLENEDEQDSPYDAWMTSDTSEAKDSSILRSQACQKVFKEYKGSKKEYPFVRTFMFKKVRYVTLGSVRGVVPEGKQKGHPVSAFFTLVPYKRLRDVPEDIAPRHNGQQLSLNYDEVSEDGVDVLRKHLFVLKHQPGMKIRWWLRLDEVDQPHGIRYVVLDDTEEGWKQVQNF